VRPFWVYAAVARLVLLASLAACGGKPPPPPPPPTLVNLTLAASADSNPDAAGDAAPVLLRVYQLASPAAFSGAEFFRLYNSDAAALGPDLIKRDDYLLAPGKTKAVNLAPTAQVKAIGVFAAYRDFQHATWRALADVPPNRTTDLVVTAGRAAVLIAPAPSPKPDATTKQGP
jgi:type VI secretion system protein VasD